MPGPATHLGDLAVERFMREFWQKRPVLLRDALAPWTCPITPTDLLALACDEDADSRLILTGEEPPEIHYGPFEPEELDGLPVEAWTVLVQEVERLLPAVSRLQDRFRFLPNWRLDDVMVSYAVPGGGVGAHIDQYDVFLIQGTGRRRWEIESEPVTDPSWRSDSEVAILAAFEPDLAWELDPGDVLYLPPGIPHNGVALEPCLTLSIGCRAPDTAELLSSLAALVAEDVGDTERYADPDLDPTTDPGRIERAALARLRQRIRDALGDDEGIDRLIGRTVTQPVRGRTGPVPDGPLDLESLRRRLRDGGRIRPAVAAQAAYVVRDDGSVTLFAAGEAHDLPAGTVETVARLTGVEGGSGDSFLENPAMARVAVRLVNAGVFVVERD